VAIASRPRVARAARAACAALVVAALTGACDTKAQFAPSLPAAAGFRVDDGVLKVWTGTPCDGVFRVTVLFDTGTKDSTTQEWTAPKPGVRLERMDLLRNAGGPSTRMSPGASSTGSLSGSPDAGGLQVTTPLPVGYDWAKAGWLNFSVSGPPSWGARVEVARVLRESSQHPAGSYLFGDRGWMDASDVQRENRTSFLTMCTPDPKTSR